MCWQILWTFPSNVSSKSLSTGPVLAYSGPWLPVWYYESHYGFSLYFPNFCWGWPYHLFIRHLGFLLQIVCFFCFIFVDLGFCLFLFWGVVCCFSLSRYVFNILDIYLLFLFLSSYLLFFHLFLVLREAGKLRSRNVREGNVFLWAKKYIVIFLILQVPLMVVEWYGRKSVNFGIRPFFISLLYHLVLV